MPERGARSSSSASVALASDVERNTGVMPRPPPSSGACLSDSREGRSTEDTEPRLVLSLREPLADEQLPRTVIAQLDTDARRSQPLTKVRSLLGRGPDADVHVADPKASRKHASIFFTGTEFRVRDESSVNGTLMNGSRVVEYAIRDGDELLVGDTLLRFRDSAPVSVPDIVDVGHAVLRDMLGGWGMVTLKVGERVRFSALAASSVVEDAPPSSGIRGGDVWEGIVMALSWDVEGRQIVTVKVDLVNGSRTVGMKEVYADEAKWELP